MFHCNASKRNRWLWKRLEYVSVSDEIDKISYDYTEVLSYSSSSLYDRRRSELVIN